MSIYGTSQKKQLVEIREKRKDKGNSPPASLYIFPLPKDSTITGVLFYKYQGSDVNFTVSLRVGDGEEKTFRMRSNYINDLNETTTGGIGMLIINTLADYEMVLYYRV